jgi:hypothetical protein
MAGTVGLLLSVAAIDIALPFHPIQTALGGKATLERQAQDLSPENSFGSRLQMWDQTVQIGLRHPHGTGNGSFRDTLAAYLKYPGVVFASAHNYYLETFATGGWPRLLALMAVLWGLVAAWRSERWVWALGAAGLWFTLAFDITGMYPSVMMLAFAALGASQPKAQPPAATLARVGYVPLAVMLVLLGWWYWPGGNTLKRHQFQREEVLGTLPKLSPAEQLQLLDQAAHKNPNSAWVYRSRLERTLDPSERLQLLRQVTAKFPLLSPHFYLEQARLAQAAGEPTEAVAALRQGLSIFPSDFKAAKTPLTSDDIYQDWAVQAPRLLKQLEAQ